MKKLRCYMKCLIFMHVLVIQFYFIMYFQLCCDISEALVFFFSMEHQNFNLSTYFRDLLYVVHKVHFAVNFREPLFITWRNVLIPLRN